ncbi:hypothetical protein [Streptomyces sp. NBC_00356]|uniref:hypothetical protein n=1 Tax=Streptomyces sp. NBC_00356 TaxID=2975724 RepID=UPI002E2622C6
MTITENTGLTIESSQAYGTLDAPKPGKFTAVIRGANGKALAVSGEQNTREDAEADATGQYSASAPGAAA